MVPFDDIRSKLTMLQTKLLRGRVEDFDGKPVNNAEVRLFMGLPEPLLCNSDDTGAFAFESVKPGLWILRVTAPGLMVCNQEILIPKDDGNDAQTVIRLEKGECELRGHIKEADNHPLRAEVTLLRSGRVVLTAKTQVKTGEFNFPYLSEGKYEVYATSPCHGGRSWIGAIGRHSDIDIVLPVIEECVAFDTCDVCEERKMVRYCKFCHALICDDCRHNYPERIKAMLRRQFSRQSKSEEEIQLEIEKELKDTTNAQRKRCSHCP